MTPIVDGLEAYFDGQIEFYHLDTDQVDHKEIGQRVGLYRHTQYLLIDKDGSIVQEWNGYLREDMIYDEIIYQLSIAQ